VEERREGLNGGDTMNKHPLDVYTESKSDSGLSPDWSEYRREEMVRQSKYKTVATIRSFTDERQYKLKKDPDGNLSCNCPAWIFNKSGEARTCKHLRAFLSEEFNMERFLAQSGKFKIEIENSGNKWVIEKIEGGETV